MRVVEIFIDGFLWQRGQRRWSGNERICGASRGLLGIQNRTVLLDDDEADDETEHEMSFPVGRCCRYSLTKNHPRVVSLHP